MIGTPPYQVVVEVRPQKKHFAFHPLLQGGVERGPVDLAEEDVRLPDAGEGGSPVEVREAAVVDRAPVARGDDRLDHRLRVVVVDEVRLVADRGQHDLVETVPQPAIHVVHEGLGEIRVGKDRLVRKLILGSEVHDPVTAREPQEHEHRGRDGTNV